MLGAFMERMEMPVSAATQGPRLPPEEADSFEAFFRAEHARLLRALFVVTGSAEEAEELMQEAFLSVWERWDRVRSLDSPTGYLYRTAMNAFRSRLRRAARVARRAVGMAEAKDEYAEAEARDAVGRA